MKQKILQVLQSALNNVEYDLHHAQTVFKGLSGEELDWPYGLSGRTKREVLGGYEMERNNLVKCIEWVNSKDD